MIAIIWNNTYKKQIEIRQNFINIYICIKNIFKLKLHRKELFHTSKFYWKFRIVILSNATCFQRSWTLFLGSHLPPDCFNFKNGASKCLFIREQPSEAQMDVFPPRERSCSFLQGLVMARLLCGPMLLVVYHPHRHLLLLSTSPASASSTSFPCCSFFFSLPSSIVSLARLGFHSTNVVILWTSPACHNLDFFMDEADGKKSLFKLLTLCRHFHHFRDLWKVSCSQRFFIFIWEQSYSDVMSLNYINLNKL